MNRLLVALLCTIILVGCYQSVSFLRDGEDTGRDFVWPELDIAQDTQDFRPDIPPEAPFCGNGVIEGVEQCDDGNRWEGDGCENDCTFTCMTDDDCIDHETCNGREACDSVSHTCMPGSPMEDGFVCQDDPRSICLGEDCYESTCGDGFIDTDAGELCEPPGMGHCGSHCEPICISDEDCPDDGNVCNGEEGCNVVTGICEWHVPLPEGVVCGYDPRRICLSGTCQESICGDAFTDIFYVPPEECDDGNSNDDDACTNDCLLNTCGDGLCDDRESCETCSLDCGECVGECESFSWGGHSYAKCPSQSWEDARLFCLSVGAHLATINTASEDSFLQSVSSIAEGIDYFIGITDAAVEGVWAWESGEPVTYLGWSGDEPNNAGVGPEGEDCATLLPPSTGVGWNDVSCFFPNPFLCEWDHVLCADVDSDGFAAVSCGGDDCNDANDAIHPGASETCNGVDDNCDGVADEDCLGLISAVTTISPGPSCSGEYDRMGTIIMDGCPTVTITGAFMEYDHVNPGQVVLASSSDWSFDLTWDDEPPGGDCDLDISGITSWIVDLGEGWMTVTVTHSVTGYEALRTLACGYTITDHGTVLLGEIGATDTQSFTYSCAP